MNFPQFWAKAECGNFSCWRWSVNSVEEAQDSARAAAEKLAERFNAGELLRGSYGYGDGRPMRELVLREWRAPDGALTAAITRNSYGCLVLNTAQVMFVDVDAPEQKSSGLGGLFGGLFGKKKVAPAENPLQTELLAKANQIVQKSPGWGWRVYKTRAGFRLLATHKLFDPADGEMDPVFDELGADPLYRHLCKSQKCYRARLTPKPWRCSVYDKPPRWPWPDAKAEQHFKKWEAKYLSECEEWATCELIATLGNAEVNPAVQPIVAAHDEATRAESKLPLA